MNSEKIYRDVAQVSQALCAPDAISDVPNVDLRARLADCLSILGDAALLATLRGGELKLRVAAPRGRFTPAELTGVEARLSTLLESPEHEASDRFHFVVDGLEVLGSWFRERATEKRDGREVEIVRFKGYAALCFRKIEADYHDLFVSLHSRTTAGHMYQLLEKYNQRFLPFSPKMTAAYWLRGTNAFTRNGTQSVPWQRDVVQAVTLAYDLRRSTFCMDQSYELDQFARWIDQLVRILRRLAHHFGGAFDKFTGDGGLVHFIEPWNNGESMSAADAAFETAIAMQQATARHLSRLRKFLFLNSGKLGAGIGIGLGDTCWSLDHRNNPIVVGRGVVHACRLNAAPAGAIRLTNLAFESLSLSNQKLFVEIDLVTKEHTAEEQSKAWQFVVQERVDVASRWTSIVDEICDAIYSGRDEGRTART